MTEPVTYLDARAAFLADRLGLEYEAVCIFLEAWHEMPDAEQRKWAERVPGVRK